MDDQRENEYALCVVQFEEHTVFVRKNKPAWQKGRLNLPGGSIEWGETPEQAAKRELREETGLVAFKTEKVGVIEGPDWRVHVIRCDIGPVFVDVEQMTLEWVFWAATRNAIRLGRHGDHQLIQNLRIIIPLVSMGVKGWKITYATNDEGGPHILEFA